MTPKINAIYCGDCQDVLRSFPSDFVHLIYLDPPFCSNRLYSISGEDGEIRAFDDRWKGGLHNYLAWMEDKIAECKRILKRTGSIFLHCDPHSSHYLKVMMDQIFGRHNFRNEIIWKRQSSHNDSKQGSRHFGRVHDVILLYSKSEHMTWHPRYRPYSRDYVNRAYRYLEPRTGKKYALGDLGGPGGATKGCPKFTFLGFTRYWRYNRKRMFELYRQGRIVQTRTGSVPKLKRYLDEMPGSEVQDIWDDIPPVNNGKERVGYPTQKPEKLLERIINAGTNPWDVVLDPFCGCGTALAVAQKLGRNWIGIDNSFVACCVVQRRLARLGVAARISRPVRHRNQPSTRGHRLPYPPEVT